MEAPEDRMAASYKAHTQEVRLQEVHKQDANKEVANKQEANKGEVNEQEVNTQKNQRPTSPSSGPVQNAKSPNSGNQKKKIAIIVAIVLLTLVVVVILIAVLAVRGESSGSVSRKVCTSPHCNAIASTLKATMNPAVDPCVDFYQYSCGKWSEKNPIPPGQNAHSSFGTVSNELLVTLRDALKKPIENTDIDAIKKPKKLYQACADRTVIDELDTGPLYSLLNELGGWPIISETWSEADFSLTTLLAKVKLLSVTGPVNFEVVPNLLNAETRIIELMEAELGLPVDKFLKGRQDKDLVAYENLAIEVAVEMNAKQDVAKQDVDQIIEFEIKLAKAVPQGDGIDFEQQHNTTKIKDVGAKLPNSVDWVRYFVAVFETVNMKIDENEELTVRNPDYIKDVEKIMNEASKRTLANYILWRVIMVYLYFMPWRFVEIRRKLDKLQDASIGSNITWKYCTLETKYAFEMALGRLLVENRFSKDAKASASRMILSIQESFKKTIQEVDWMLKDTKKSAQEKVDAMLENIGFPDYILNDEALNKEYQGIDVDPKQFFNNGVAVSRLQIASNLASLRVPVDRKSWPTGPAVVNAFYNPHSNSIVFPAGIFSPPFYHPESPMSMNYGGIGTVMGHEITHGFDNNGRLFDKKGNVALWWVDEDIDNFNKKAQCLVEQYNNYTTSSVQIDGEISLGENIADNGGLKAAFQAYKKWADSNDPEPSLPEIDFTDEQLFFINFAQVWCGAEQESTEKRPQTTPHCPGMIRVIGSVSNSPDFAKVFKCKSGSKMNPVKKCIVW